MHWCHFWWLIVRLVDFGSFFPSMRFSQNSQSQQKVGSCLFYGFGTILALNLAARLFRAGPNDRIKHRLIRNIDGNKTKCTAMNQDELTLRDIT